MNRNLRLEKETRKSKKKPKVDIPEDENRAVGEWSKEYARELGIIIRQDAPIRVKSWKHIPKFEKRRLYRLIQVYEFFTNYWWLHLLEMLYNL